MENLKAVKYWITSHWPPREGDSPTPTSFGLYLPDGREEAGAEVAAGDMILIYEAASGRTAARKNPDGTEEKIRCIHGREGIIAICQVLRGIKADSGLDPEFYSDGSSIWWRWYAPLKTMTTTGYIPRIEMNPVIGHEPNYNLRGFGKKHSGLKQISADEFAKLRDMFKGKSMVLPSYPPPRGNRTSAAGTNREESAEHRDLKDHVANRPDVVLQESGLKTLGVEYPFPTGDRADIILEDSFGRVIGLEVEVRVDDNQIEGLLQAIKYRRMMELIADRNPGDSRSMLVAYHIFKKMKTLAKKYGIEFHEIKSEAVKLWRQHNPR